MGLITMPTTKKENGEDIITEEKSIYQGSEDILKRQVDVVRDYKTAQDYVDDNWREFNEKYSL